MNTKFCAWVLLALLCAGIQEATAQLPVISSFSQNGQLVGSYLAPGTMASVEWASSLSGPWQTNWAGLNAVTVDSNGMISVSVPMFYRVRGMAYTPIFTADGMALIPAGPFTMGDTLDGETDAIPISVTVSAFYMGTNLVTYSLWQPIYSYALSQGYGFDNAGSGKAANHPVQTVNWYDAVKWCNARSQQAGLTPVYYTDTYLTQVYTNGDVDTVYPNWAAGGYRLPTEAEWEKAARGGLAGNRFPWGNSISESQANYYGETGSYSYDLGPNGYNAIGNYPTDSVGTSPVGYFAPNGYGLFDMAGDVDDWCWDWYGTPYGQPTTTNPTGPATGSYRVARGGYWDDFAYPARCAGRSSSYYPHYDSNADGFRCVRGL